ncbi:MAG: hypothetical protein D3904_03140 [Candidatus Electrothrix sp. EH2]|nr:hypothetical protein [Candidatus Electrothrix sp. EH2]
MSQIQTLYIQSEYIAKWIGNTEKQEEILQEFSGKLPSRWDGAIEFEVDIGNKDILKLFYSISKYYSSPEFNCTLNFPPVLCLSLGKSIEDKHLNIYIDKSIICLIF